MKTVKPLISWVILGLVFFLPLFFLPITSEFYAFNKQTFLIAVTGVLLVLWALRLLLEKELKFNSTPLDLPILLFAFAHVLTVIVASPNKIEAFLEPTSLATVLGLTAFYFIITNNLEKKFINHLLLGFTFSGGLLSLVAIYQFLGLGTTFSVTPWLQNPLFSPAGDTLTLVSFLVLSLIITLVLFLKKFNRQEWLPSLWFFVPTIFIALGLGFTLYQILPDKEAGIVFPPLGDSWAIAVESFKQNPFFGVGPGNYLSAFNRFRPVAFNNYEFWNTRLTNATNYPLQLLAVGGLIILAAYFFLLLKAIILGIRNYRENKTNDFLSTLSIGSLGLLFIQFVLPINFLILSSAFLFLALQALSQTKEKGLYLQIRTLNLILLGVAAVIALTSFYLWGRVYAADYYFRKSLNALDQNQGILVYNYQIQAASLNPYLPLYHRAYSQTNLALANAIAQAAQGELSDQDRTNITQLIQQAIREAKLASALNQSDAVNWENLSQIYRNLVNFAQGADQWALASYRQAVATDPINPRIRVNLGGFLYSLGSYEAATRQFQNAVDLKPDYANGYYNLSAAYRERKMYEEAYQAMQLALNFVPADSTDYQKVSDELNELAKKLPPEATSAAQPVEEETEEVLTPPEPLPSPAIQPPIELPEESSPEIPEVEIEEETPTPLPTP